MSLVRRCLAVAAFAAVLTLQAGSALAVTVPPQSVLCGSILGRITRLPGGGLHGLQRRFWPTHPTAVRHGSHRSLPDGVRGRSAHRQMAPRPPPRRTTMMRRYPQPTAELRGLSRPCLWRGTVLWGYQSHQRHRVPQRWACGRGSARRHCVERQRGRNRARKRRGLDSGLSSALPATRGRHAGPHLRLTLSVDAAAGGTVAWAVGAEYPDQQNSSVTRSLIYRTANGGSSWVTETVTSAAVDISAVTAANADVAYATYLGAGVGSRYFLRRSSAGVWTRSYQQIALGVPGKRTRCIRC